MSAPVRRFPLAQQHDAAHAATHARWLDVMVLRYGVAFGRFVTEACCDERLIEKLAAAAGVAVTGAARVRTAGDIEMAANVDGTPARIVITRELSTAPIKAYRERWIPSAPPGRKPFRVTGRKGITAATGRTVRGPCTYVDKRVIDLLIETTRALYKLVNIARGINVTFADDRHAVNEMVLGMGVLTASEADALATLLQYDQLPTSRIHARAIGEHSEHVSAFMVDWALALRAYEATNASRQELLDKMTLPNPVRQAVLQRIDASHEPRTMQKIMRAAQKQIHDSPVAWMTAAEHSWLSKWNHGDAVALQEIADRLTTAGDDLWAAINAIEEGDGLALRSIVHMLRVLYALTGLFGANQTPVDELRTRHAALVDEFHARIPAHLRSTPPAQTNGGSNG